MFKKKFFYIKRNKRFKQQTCWYCTYKLVEVLKIDKSVKQITAKKLLLVDNYQDRPLKGYRGDPPIRVLRCNWYSEASLGLKIARSPTKSYSSFTCVKLNKIIRIGFEFFDDRLIIDSWSHREPTSKNRKFLRVNQSEIINNRYLSISATSVL